MNAEFLKGFSDDPETRKQADHIWKMLDQMAEDNPDGYKKFVQQNIEDGTKDLKKKQEDSLQAQMVTPTPKLVFKMFANLTSKADQPEADGKFNINQTQILDAKSIISKLDKRVKFYLNLMVHPNVMQALNHKREECDDIKQWQLVPLSFTQLTQRASTSFQYKVYFVDVVINDKVYDKILSSIQKTDDYFMSLLKDTFQIRLMQDRNPIQVDFKLLSTTYYYEFEKLSCSVVKNKQYRQFNNKGPSPLLLEYQINKIAQDQIKKKQQEQPKQQDLKFKQEEIKESSQIETNIESRLGLDKKQVKKSPLIQEIQQTQVQVLPPAIVLPKTPDFTLVDSGTVITVVIQLPKVTTFSEIDMNISKQQIKLQVSNTYDFEQLLSHPVNNDNLEARWDKKNHKLTIKLTKL